MTRSHGAASPCSHELPDIRPKPLAIRELPAGLRQPFAERRDIRSREMLLRRVRGEFDEMPGLRLTLAQAQRLFTLRKDVCERVLNTLTLGGVLSRTRDDRYARRDVVP